MNFDFFVNKHVNLASYDVNIFALYYFIAYLAIATIIQKHYLFVSNNFFFFVRFHAFLTCCRDLSILCKIFEFAKFVYYCRLIDDFCLFYSLFIYNEFDDSISRFNDIRILIENFRCFSFVLRLFFSIELISLK